MGLSKWYLFTSCSKDLSDSDSLCSLHYICTYQDEMIASAVLTYHAYRAEPRLKKALTLRGSSLST